MFEIKITNISKDYKLYIDNEEKFFCYSNLKMSGSYKGFLDKGKHQIRIRKDPSSISQSKLIFSYWLLSLVASYDEVSIAAIRSHEIINVVIDIDIQNESSFMIFDAHDNQVKNCSEEYVILQKEICEDKKKKHNVWKFIKIPVIVLGMLTFVPLFVLSCFLIVASFDIPSLLLFVLSSFLLLLFIIYLRKEVFRKK